MNAEQMEGITRHFVVAAESIRSDVRQIAEDHATICHALQDLRGEIRDEFKVMCALMRPSYSQLNQQVRPLESAGRNECACIVACEIRDLLHEERAPSLTLPRSMGEGWVGDRQTVMNNTG